MKKHFNLPFIVSVLALCFLPMWGHAGPIGIDQARQTVEKFRKAPTRGGKRSAKLAAGNLQHAFTQSTATGAPAVYVFNTDGGFVLASADDATTPILGYSDNGEFDPNNIPDGLKYLMGEYAKQIAALPPVLSANQPTPNYEVEPTTPVGPLLKTQWDQEAPYNLECPSALSPTGRAATGCMTTAIAQIMRFHEWPKKGVGSREMMARQGVGSVKVVRDYYTHTYDWNAMPLNKSQYTSQGASAVSQLMMDVAVGLNTEFAGVSSAVHIAIIPMMLSYFNYDPSMEIVQLKKMTTEEFNHILIADLQAGRPVYFQGGPNSAGHAFVCDGYDGAGRFHINWGWSGRADGHFLITNLSPSEAGTGGVANAGYSESLLMIHNIMPYQGGELPRPEIKAAYTREIKPGIKMEKSGSGYYFGGNFGVYPQTTTQQRNIRARMGVYVQKQGSSSGQIVWNQHQDYTELTRTNPYYDFRVNLESAWMEPGTRVSYIYQECGASDWQYIDNTRGDRCVFSIERNAAGDLVAVADKLEYVLQPASPSTPANPVSVTYNIYLDNTKIGQTTVTESLGQAPTKNFVPDYVNATGFPTTITSGTTTYDIRTSYASTMPIKSGTTPYNISFDVEGNSYMWTVSGGLAKEIKNPTVANSNDNNAKWRIVGDWFNGFSIQNVGSGQYLTTPVDNEDAEYRALVAAKQYGDRSLFLLQHRSEGYCFRSKASQHYLAHTQPTSLEVNIFDQPNYVGNLVRITEPGTLPQATGVLYTVSISGQPAGSTPKLTYDSHAYGDGQQFSAVALTQSALSVTKIEGYTSQITIGARTIYVVYTPNALTGVTYSVSIVGQPAGQEAVLTYDSNTYVNGSELTAMNLTLGQLSATPIEGYTCKIEIRSTSIIVTYTRISYVTYTVNFAGQPAGSNPVLYYNSKAVTGAQFRAGDLTLEQLSATYIPGYSYRISISGSTITVTYYALQFHFNTQGGYARTVLTQYPVTVSYYGYDGVNNIFGSVSQYTEVKSSAEPIVRIQFEGIRDFGGITATVGQLNVETGEWTCAEGTTSVRFNGGDGYSTGLTVYLKQPEAPQNTHEDVTLTLGETGYTTFYYDGKYGYPSDLKVYYCVDTHHGVLTLEQWTEDYIPGGTACILQGHPNATYILPALDEEEQDATITDNALCGYAEATSLYDAKVEYDADNIYVFSRVDGQYGFYKFGGQTLAAHKAFYAPRHNAGVNGFVLNFGELVGISTTEVSAESNEAAYDLQGRYLSRPQKGIYILGGKKILK